MEIRYEKRQIARILGVSEKQLSEADELPELKQLEGEPGVFGPEHLSAYRKALGRHPAHLPVRRQLFLNFKGGTGKTTLSVAYAYRLAEMGYRVLLVDLDSQGHATRHLGLDSDRTLHDVLVQRIPISNVVLRTPLAEFDLVPSNLGMSTIDLALMPMAGREYRLRKALEELQHRYDFIVMDAPPSFGLLNLNALIAADDLVVPVLPDFLSFHGLKLLFETLTGLEEDLGHTLQRILVVLNQYNPTTRIAREARSALGAHYPEYLTDTIIRQSTQFAQASSEGVPITAHSPTSKGAKDVDALIAEMMQVTTTNGTKEGA